MDTKKLESVVLTELHDKHGLDSLKAQNHLYGCFIVMEDIAESAIKKEGTMVTSEDSLVFDLDTQFSEIGIRYGFAMDTNLEYVHHSPEYKAAWLECFDSLGVSRDISVVEGIEDSINTIIQNNVKPEDAYFMNSLEQGILPKVWQDKVIKLILGSKPPKPVLEKEEELPTNHLSHANVEKPMLEKHTGDRQSLSVVTAAHKQRTLHKTRRNRPKDAVPITAKKTVSKTRRSIRT
jgi:hypothetical protein